MSFRVIVAGSRGFSNYGFLAKTLDYLLQNKGSDVVIISGTARGTDQMGERYAAEHGLKVVRFPAEWDKYGKSAGYRRNEEMARNADAAVIFWDGVSRGSKHMIDIAKEHKLQVRIKIVPSS